MDFLPYDSYDTIAKTSAYFHDKSISRPEEVFESIAEIHNPTIHAKCIICQQINKKKKI